MGWRLARLALAATLCANLAGCDRPRRVEARPALYLVEDADTRIWLFGTVHLLPPSVAWESPAILAAESAADTLVTELPTLAPGVAAQQFVRLGQATGLPPILERVPPGQRDQLRKRAAELGIPLDQLDAMKSWAAALTLSMANAAADSDARADYGAEAVIARRFAGRPRLGLETLDQQLALFDGLAEADQRRLLAAALDRTASYQTTLDAWAKGDEAGLARLVAAPLADAPAIEAALLTGRNSRWASWIARRMAKPGRVFVAVGAGHLAGPSSVIARLRAQGLKVARLQ